MKRGRGNTELQFHPLYTTLPRLPKEAQGGFQAIFLDHQDHWFSNILKQQDCETQIHKTEAEMLKVHEIPPQNHAQNIT